MFHDDTPTHADGGHEQFQKVFCNLKRLRHQNIVRLLGYCYETQQKHMEYEGRKIFCEKTQRALSSEYMHNGDLDKYLLSGMIVLYYSLTYTPSVPNYLLRKLIEMDVSRCISATSNFGRRDPFPRQVTPGGRSSYISYFPCMNHLYICFSHKLIYSNPSAGAGLITPMFVAFL